MILNVFLFVGVIWVLIQIIKDIKYFLIVGYSVYLSE